MTIRQNIPRFVLREPPVVGSPLSCGAQRDNSITNAINKEFAATEAASIKHAKIIRQFNDDDKITEAKCANIPFTDPVPCVRGQGTSIVIEPRCNSGGARVASENDLEQMMQNCMNALLKDREDRNEKERIRYDAETAAADAALVKDIAAAANAFTACCKANKNSEGCISKTPTTV